MGKLYKILAGMLLCNALGIHAGELQPIDLDGPYQTSPQKPGEKDQLHKTLLAALQALPDTLVTIIAHYFPYQSSEGITLYQEEDTEKLTNKFVPQRNGRPIPYSLFIIHAHASSVTGHELLTTVERTTGLPRQLFVLRDILYRKDSNHEKDRDLTIKESDKYGYIKPYQYSFEMQIPKNKEFEAREQLAKYTKKRSLKKSTKRKIRVVCIIA